MEQDSYTLVTISWSGLLKKSQHIPGDFNHTGDLFYISISLDADRMHTHMLTSKMVHRAVTELFIDVKHETFWSASDDSVS